MTMDERLRALAETVKITAGMQEKNERSIEALAAMQVRTFEIVRATNESVQTMAKNVQAMAEGIDRMAKNVGRNMEVLIQYAHRHADWLEQLEKRDRGA